MGFESNLPAMKKAIEKQQVDILKAIGLFIDGEAVLRVPVDTGNLRSSITHKVNAGNKSVVLGTPVEYAIFVEKGTGKSVAQPFLTPALEENFGKIKKIVKGVKFKHGIT